MEIKQLKQNLDTFLARIKQINTEYDEETRASIYLDYKELYEAYKKLDKKKIEENFSENEIKAIKCLSLGLKNEKRFNKIIEQFSIDSTRSISNVVDFIKSREGFDLINSDSDFSKFSDKELIDIFGGLFGINITKECVKSLRAEKVGRVVGYALSELFDKDLLEFKEIQKTKPRANFANFLRDKIQNSDFECSYLYNELANGVEVNCKINEEMNATITEVRGRNRVDHCFVNHESRLITFGQSTSNKDTESQGYSFYKGFLAIKELISKEYVDGEKNPYFGYKMRPYFMLGGRFVVDNADIKQEKGRDFKKMLPNATLHEMNLLAQMQYFRLYGNAVNKEQVNSLPQFNTFVAGCDSLELYKLTEEMALRSSNEEKNKFCFNHLTSYLKDICDVLSKNDISFIKEGKVDAKLFVDDILAITQNIPMNFNFKLSKSEYEKSILPLNKSLAKLITNIAPKAGQYGIATINRLQDFNDYILSSHDSYNKKIEKTIVADIGNVGWKDTPKNFDNLTISNLSFVNRLAEHVELQMGTQGKRFFDKFRVALSEKIINNLQLDDVFDATKFRASQSHFLKEYGYTPAAEFIEKTKFILDERLTDESISKKSKELIKYVNKKLLKTYPEIEPLISSVVIKKPKI